MSKTTVIYILKKQFHALAELKKILVHWSFKFWKIRISKRRKIVKGKPKTIKGSLTGPKQKFTKAVIQWCCLFAENSNFLSLLTVVYKLLWSIRSCPGLESQTHRAAVRGHKTDHHAPKLQLSSRNSKARGESWHCFFQPPGIPQILLMALYSHSSSLLLFTFSDTSNNSGLKNSSLQGEQWRHFNTYCRFIATWKKDNAHLILPLWW